MSTTSVAVRGPWPPASTVGAVELSAHDSGEGSFSPARRNLTNVLRDGHAGEAGGEDGAPVGLGFTQSDVAPSGAGEPVVKSADAREGGEDGRLIRHAASPATAPRPRRLGWNAEHGQSYLKPHDVQPRLYLLHLGHRIPARLAQPKARCPDVIHRRAREYL